MSGSEAEGRYTSPRIRLGVFGRFSGWKVRVPWQPAAVASSCRLQENTSADLRGTRLGAFCWSMGRRWCLGLTAPAWQVQSTAALTPYGYALRSQTHRVYRTRGSSGERPDFPGDSGIRCLNTAILYSNVVEGRATSVDGCTRPRMRYLVEAGVHQSRPRMGSGLVQFAEPQFRRESWRS